MIEQDSFLLAFDLVVVK